MKILLFVALFSFSFLTFASVSCNHVHQHNQTCNHGFSTSQAFVKNSVDPKENQEKKLVKDSENCCKNCSCGKKFLSIFLAFSFILCLVILIIMKFFIPVPKIEPKLKTKKTYKKR